MTATIRRDIQAVDKALRISSIGPIPELRDRALAREKLLATLSSFFSLLALLLAAIGLYGLMAYAVVRRTQEIGVRMALGARRTDVLRLVLGRTILLVFAGIIIGVPSALVAARLISSELFGVSAALLLAVAGLAGYVPVRRASRVDPMEALRYE